MPSENACWEQDEHVGTAVNPRKVVPSVRHGSLLALNELLHVHCDPSFSPGHLPGHLRLDLLVEQRPVVVQPINVGDHRRRQAELVEVGKDLDVCLQLLRKYVIMDR